MFYHNKFSSSASAAIKLAGNAAADFGHSYIGSEHILLGILTENIGCSRLALKNLGVTVDIIKDKIEKQVGSGKPDKGAPQGMTNRAKKIIELAVATSLSMGTSQITSEHLLLAILREGNNMALQILGELGVDSIKLYKEIIRITGRSEEVGLNSKDQRREKTIVDSKLLSRHGKDLTALAVSGKLDPVIGRDREIRRIIQVLSRRSKNNPALIGDPGVGKTAIIEGLAINIASGVVPDVLLGKRIISLDMTSVISGTKYRGEFEERIRGIIDELTNQKDIIVFIDEMHILVGAGSAEGAIDAANILKPALARAEIQLIGATTLEEYRKHIESDSALERRLQPIFVEEPTEVEAIAILQGIRDKYETHHNMQITDGAIKAAVTLSTKYITDRYLPDKAIDILDEGAAKKRLDSIENECTEELVLTHLDITKVVSEITGFKNMYNRKSLHKIEISLAERIVGQYEAIERLSRSIKRNFSGLRDESRPIGSFVFAGESGIGKSALAKELAIELFGGDKNLIRLDMSEYMERHSISKIIGAAPGYVGFGDNTGLCEGVRRRPYSVILLDEIEKAHPDILNILLQILEDGCLTSSKGRKIDFKNTIIIMTTNLGCNKGNKGMLGFNNNKDSRNDGIKSELKNFIRAEILNRIDDVIIFESLGENTLGQIAELMLSKLVHRADVAGIRVEYGSELTQYIGRKAAIKNEGARGIRRIIEELIEYPISEMYLKEGFDKECGIYLCIENDEVVVSAGLVKI